MSQTTSPMLIGMGNPLLDMIAHTPAAFLEKYGLKADDAILADEKHVNLFKDMSDSFDVQYLPGGATQNAVRVAQAFFNGLDNRGNACGMIGCIGKDERGNQIKTLCIENKMLPLYQESDVQETGLCGVIVTGHHRSQITSLKAANAFTIDHLKTKAIETALESAKIVYSASFFLTVCPDGTRLVADKMIANGKIFCTNLSAPFLVDFFKSDMLDALSYSDYVFGNESEFARFGEVHIGENAKDVDVLTYIANLAHIDSKRKRTVIMTQGSNETMIVDGTGAVSRYPVTPVKPDSIVDTIGAGDAFVGGFLYGLCYEKSLSTCVDLGHYAASKIIQCDGATFESTATLLGKDIIGK